MGKEFEEFKELQESVGRGSRKTAGSSEASGTQPLNKRRYAVKRAEPWSSARSRLGAPTGLTDRFSGEIPATPLKW
jgi:hypothetical protein